MCNSSRRFSCGDLNRAALTCQSEAYSIWVIKGWAAADFGCRQQSGGRQGHAPVRPTIIVGAGPRLRRISPCFPLRRFVFLCVLLFPFGRLMPAISPERMRDRYETILSAA